VIYAIVTYFFASFGVINPEHEALIEGYLIFLYHCIHITYMQLILLTGAAGVETAILNL
jgi:hypothetical protein